MLFISKVRGVFLTTLKITLFIFITQTGLYAIDRVLPSSTVMSARDRAMGGASLLSVSSATSVFENPSRMPLSLTSGFSITYSYDALSESFNKQRGAFSFLYKGEREGKPFAIGIGVKTDIDYGIEYYDTDNNYLGSVLYADTLSFINTGFEIGKNQFVGFGIRFTASSLDSDGAFGGGLDFAYSGSLFLDDLKVGVLIENFGGLYSADNTTDIFFNLDTIINAALGYNDSKERFSAAMKLAYALPSSSLRFSIGAEVRLIKFRQYLREKDFDEDEYSDAIFDEEFAVKVKPPLPGGLYIRAGLENTTPSLGIALNLYFVRISYTVDASKFSEKAVNHSIGIETLF